MSEKCCHKCGLAFPATTEYFRKDASKKDGLTYFCRACMYKRDKENRPGSRNGTKHTWPRGVPMPREEKLKRMRKASRASYRKYKDQRLAQSAVYRKQHPEIYREAWRRHKAQKLAAQIEPSILINAALKRNKHVCYWCGCRLPITGWHVDHVVPLTRGGGHSASNVVKSCVRCNTSKSDKMPYEWTGAKQLVML